MTHIHSRGSILLLALIIGAVIMSVTTAYFGYVGSALHAERFSVTNAQAAALAEAGVDQAVYQLNQNSSYAGETDTALGAGTFTVSVATINGSTKRVTSTGYIPNRTRPTASKTITATVGINSSIVSFRYGVQSGQGGVQMGNGSTIEGNLFSNGNVSGGGTITGDVTVAESVDPVANQQSTNQNSTFKIGDTSAHADVSQSFRPSATAPLTRLTLYLKKSGNPNDLSILIVSDNSGKPSKTVLATGTIPASTVTTSFGWEDVTLTSNPTVTAGTNYWIIAVAPAISSTDNFTWGLDTNGTYGNGAAKYSSNWNASSPTWNSITGDLDFMMYLTGVPTTLSGVSVGGNAWASGLSSCSITGNASYQTISGCSVGGTKTPNTAPAVPVPFPISDAQIADWEATAEAGGVITGPYQPSGTITLGPKKINGDLTITNGAVLNMSGPIWVNGNVNFSNNASLLVSPSTGTAGAMIIADSPGNTATKGTVVLSNNVIINGNGSTGSYPMIISTNTGNHAIDMSNNASSIILYAPYGGIEVSNGANANQITARLLELENNSSITYQSGLQSTSFSNGPGGSWAVVLGTYGIAP